MDVLRPFPSFYFRVALEGAAEGPDGGFQDASGLDAVRETEVVAEGGENRFFHRLPGRVRHRNLALKRGLLPAASPLRQWCVKAIQSDLGNKVEPRGIDVSLLDPDGNPVATWSLRRAWPMRLQIGAFDAYLNAPAIETLEFAFAGIQRRDGSSQPVTLGFG